MLKRKQLNKIKGIFKKLPRSLAENAFLSFLVLTFLALILGGLVFYEYILLVQEKEPEVLEKPLYLNEKSFQEILKTWQERQKKFEEAEFEEYFNPFKVD